MVKKQNQMNTHLTLFYGIELKVCIVVRTCVYTCMCILWVATSSGRIMVTHIFISLQHALSLIFRLALQTVAGVRPLHKATESDVIEAEKTGQQTSICTDAILSVPIGDSNSVA